jgi:hypothetical protein
MVDSAIRFKNNPVQWIAICRSTPWYYSLDQGISWFYYDVTNPLSEEDLTHAQFRDEPGPPNENNFGDYPQFLNLSAPQQPLGYKKVEVMQLCVPDVTGEVRYRQQRYRLVDDEEASTPGVMARWCYIRASIDHIERNSAGEDVILDNITFRQILLLSDLVPVAAYKDETVLKPNQVDKPGRITYIANIPPRVRDRDRRDIIEIVREFKG